MATLQARIEDYVGTWSDTTALTDWLRAGSSYILSFIPYEKLKDIAVEVSVGIGGLTLTTEGAVSESSIVQRILEVTKGGYESIEINAGLYAQVIDENSIHYALSDSPKHLIKNKKLYVYPSGGTALLVYTPEPLYSHTSIAGIPIELEHAVVLWVAVQCMIAKVREKLDEIDAITYTSPTAPTPPADASYTYTDATGTTISSITIDSFGTAPIYTKPTKLISWTNIGTYIATEEDLEKATTEINKLGTQLDEFGKDLYNELNEVGVELEVYKANVQKVLELARIDLQIAIDNAQRADTIELQNKWKQVEAEIALYQSKMNKFLGQINLYRAEIQEALGYYQAQVQLKSQEVVPMINLIEELRKEFREITRLYRGGQ